MDTQIFEPLGISEEVLINKFHHEIQEIFNTMVGMDDILNFPLQVEPRTNFDDCVTAIVGFAGIFNGLLSLHVPEILALQFTSRMLGMEVAVLDDDVKDALGEIANMIAGSFKHHLSKGGHEVRLSTPSIITGKEYMFSTGSAGETLSLLYDSNGECFLVHVALEQN